MQNKFWTKIFCFIKNENMCQWNNQIIFNLICRKKKLLYLISFILILTEFPWFNTKLINSRNRLLILHIKHIINNNHHRYTRNWNASVSYLIHFNEILCIYSYVYIILATHLWLFIYQTNEANKNQKAFIWNI